MKYGDKTTEHVDSFNTWAASQQQIKGAKRKPEEE